ncbi:MAG TPA: phosphatidylserine decarboxylase [Thermoanaerobaculaceae bacterium]|nr:phosphatidylserine decarboxylase [Thermoanaerobaculaceae bacterium]
MLPFAPEGYPFVLVPVLAGIFAWVFGYPIATALFLVVALACVAFFRDPQRRSDAPPEAVLAPADGKVLTVGRSPAALGERGLPTQISIFMSPANVHVNRAPAEGTVLEARHVRGKKLPAFRDKASELNEHSFVVIEGARGTVGYKQIAGAVARRVVCDLEPGQSVTRGQRVGLIKFGSRVDLFLPGDAAVTVAPGQRTRAGVTEVARFGARERP